VKLTGLEYEKMENDKMIDIFERLNHQAKENLALCGNCAQTSFLTLMDEFQLDAEQVLKALTPFPGIALRGDTCGAVSGSLMAIGLEFGRTRENLDDWQAYHSSLRPSRKFCKIFEEKLGSTRCDEIIADKFGQRFDLADPKQAVEWFNCGAYEKCGEVISTGVSLAASIILKSRNLNEGPQV
jgi:C_GCAxxG_C_C family probable redox protein